MFDLTLAVPILIALTEAVKRAGLDSKYGALFSIVMGVVLMGFFGDGDMISNIFEGMISGLSASGLYSGTKAFLRN